MKGVKIAEILGFEPYFETDHTEKIVAKITGIIRYRIHHLDGSDEELATVIRPGENNVWSDNVIAEAQKWLDAGGIIPEWVAPSPEQEREFMEPISRRQLLHGLLSIGVYETDIDAIIAAISDETERRRAHIDWRTAQYYERMHHLVVSIGETIGQAPDQMDSLWDYFQTI